jgi:hypothetical protein
MIKRIVSTGCSFVRNSHEDENPKRANRGDTPTRPLTQLHTCLSNIAILEETNFTVELGELMQLPSVSNGQGGSGNRYTIYKTLDLVEKGKVKEGDFILIAVTEFTRFDFVRPSYSRDGIPISKWPKLPVDEYAKYYSRVDNEFEIKTLFKMASAYLDKKGIPHMFINTMNDIVSIKDIVPTFLFPDNTEYWRTYIKNYDSTYELEHPNIADHKIFAKLLLDKLVA